MSSTPETRPVPAGPASPLRRLHAALMPDYNAGAAVYWWALVLLGAGLVLRAFVELAHLPLGLLLQVIFGCGVAMVAGLFPVRIPGSKNSFAAGEVFILLLLLLQGPPAAAVAAAGEAFIGSARTSKRWTSRLVSPAAAAVSMTVAVDSAGGRATMRRMPVAAPVRFATAAVGGRSNRSTSPPGIDHYFRLAGARLDVLRVAVRRVLRFGAGPLARFSASSSAARSAVMASTESSLRRVAFTSPSVT